MFTNEKRGQATPTTQGWDKHALKMKETKVLPLKEEEEVAYLIRKSNMARKQKRKRLAGPTQPFPNACII